jgi:ankyrin repeat protein
MIDPSQRLRRAINSSSESSTLLINRILKTNPKLLHNPDTSLIGLSNSSLHLACYLGKLEVASTLLQHGHENEGISLNEEHQTPLMLAAREGHTEIVLLLCKEEAGGIAKRSRKGEDAIMMAAQNGHDTVIQIILTYAASSGITPAKLLKNADVDGNTALHFASSNGHLLVLRTLLAAGADPDVRNVWSWTAVAYSATVQSEVYFKSLVAEMERREVTRREVESRGTGGSIRMVGTTEAEEL